MGNPLPAERTREALSTIARWRAAPAEPIACPICRAPGLAIVDRSARPHAEWYALSCAACGLEHALHIPLAAPVTRLD